MNVHRWRKLEGSDPSTYELIQKIQTLQKRLIAKTEEVVEKDLLIQEKEKLYVELKNILARQPGPEVAEQLGVYQANLREKTKQMKAMASELNMFQAQVSVETDDLSCMSGSGVCGRRGPDVHALFLFFFLLQVNEYKYEIERLTADLGDMKRKYFEQKRREQIERERASKTTGPPPGVGGASGTARFTGGGFSLSTS